MYKHNVCNPLIDERLELIKKQFTIFEKNGKQQSVSKTLIREDLEGRMNELKESYSPTPVKYNPSLHPGIERNSPLFRNVKEYSNSSNNMSKSPSLPNLKSLRNNVALNNVASTFNTNHSLVSVNSYKTNDFQQQLFKQWHFKPSIQEKFKIALSTHKDRFDLL